MSVDPVSLAITVALDAASMALQASKRIEGPRVTDLNATVADYGTPLNYVYGIRRVAGACFYCEPIKEQKHHTKGKGGKYTEFRYFGTFAIIVADQHITRYSRIWFDEHLVYDITASGEVVTDPTDSSTLSQFMRQYVGGQTGPDPRMVATITEKEGPDRTPAYLDISYLMFEALPLEFLGNRFPQVSVEVDSGAAGTLVFSRTPFTLQVQGDPSFHFGRIPQSYVTSSLSAVARDSLGNSDVIGWDFKFINTTTPFDNRPGFGNNYRTFDSAVGQYTVTLDARDANGGFTVTLSSERELVIDPFTEDNGGDIHVGWAITNFGEPIEPGTAEWDPLLLVDGGPSTLKDNPFYTHNFNSLGASQYSFDVGIAGPAGAIETTLGFICDDIAKRAGMADGDHDFSALDQVIPGFSWTIADCKSIIAPLLDVYDSDIILHDFGLIGRQRGGEPDDQFVIASDFMVRQQRGKPDSSHQPLYQITMEAESDLPRRVFATFSDRTADQQPNTAVAQRDIASTVTVRELPLDVTNLALSPDEAQPLVERYLRRQWIGGTKYNYTAAPWEIALECGDIRISDLDGEQLRGRLTRLTLKADRSLAAEWEVDGALPISGASLGTLTGDVGTIIASPGASAIGRPPSQIFDPTPSRPFILDVPLVSDADDQTTPFVYLTAGRDASGGTFPGAEIQQSDTGADGTWTSGWDSVASNAEAIWGNCSTVLGNALPWIPDRANTLTVDLPNGTLESLDDEFLNANPSANLAAIGTFGGGWEIVQFGVAEIVSGTVWHVSNFYRRGAGGTERFVGTHGAGELFVLLSALVKHDLGAGKIGDTDYYVAVTNTMSPAYSDDLPVDFEAQPHRPLSPVHIALVRDVGSGDWSGTFVRRTRVGGGALNGQDVPLGEASQSYRVKVMNGASVVRTINVTTPSFTYVGADQTTDFGSHQLALTVQICQVDPTLGIEGAATTASA